MRTPALAFVLALAASCAVAASPTPVSQKQGASMSMPDAGMKINAQHVDVTQSHLLERMRQCRDERQNYLAIAEQLKGMGCDRFGSEKYKELLKSRSGSCRNFTMLQAESVSQYAVIDAALAKFADNCECRKIADAVEANANMMENVRSAACYAMTGTFGQLEKNIKLVDKEWQASCKGLVSASLQSRYDAARTRFADLKGKTSASCDRAHGCEQALADHRHAAMDVEKFRADQCKGKVHDALAKAKAMSDKAVFACQGFGKAGTEIGRNDNVRHDAILHCSSELVTMRGRCPFSSETNVKLHKKMGSYEKTNLVNVKEHWCKDERDMVWCHQYDNVRINADRSWYLVSANKTSEANYRICRAPSDWGKCKAYSSSTGACLDGK